MGLFGGFKAKFNSRVKNKPNNSKKESTVVCLSYRSFSEFEIPINVHRKYLKTNVTLYQTFID